MGSTRKGKSKDNAVGSSLTPTNVIGVKQGRSDEGVVRGDAHSGRCIVVKKTEHGMSLKFIGPSEGKLYWPDNRPLLHRVRDRMHLGLAGKHAKG